MAIIYKTSSAAWSSGWTPSLPGATNDGRVDSTTGGVSSFDGANVTFSSVGVMDTAPSTVTVTGSGGVTTIIRSQGANMPSGASVYVASGKTFSASGIEFNNTGTPAHTVRTDGTLIASFRSTTANTNNLTKTGAGEWTCPFNTNNKISTLSIQEGTFNVSTAAGVIWSINSTVTLQNNATLRVSSSGRTATSPIALSTGGGTISIDPGIATTFSGAFSGSTTLTKAGTGTMSVTASNLGMPLAVNAGTLSLGSGFNITSSTLTGSGTVAFQGVVTSTLNGTNAPSYTGSLTGLFNYRAATRASALTMRGNVAGTVRVLVGTITFTNPTNSGYLEIIEDADVTLNNSFFNGSGGDGLTGSWVYMKNPRAILRLVGPGAGCAQGRWYAPRANSHIYLTQGATLSTDRYYADQLEFGVSDNYVISGDTNTNTFNASVIMAAGTPAAPARVNFICRTAGTFVVAGTLYASTPVASSGNADFTFNVYTPQPNGEPEPATNYQGTIRWSGTCAGSISNLSVGRGTLQIVRSSTTSLAAGLTVASGATLHCATTGAAYAAQLSGNLTLSAGSIMKFGAAA